MLSDISPITIFSFFCALFIAYCLYFVYKFYVKPAVGLLYYKKQTGVKVLYHCRLLSSPKNHENAVTKGDFYYTYKEILRQDPSIKVVAENFGTRCHLSILDPEVLKQYLSKYDNYHKDLELYNLAMDLERGSITFEEAEAWKRRRRMVSSAFNFEFLKNVIPMIIRITQEQFKDWVAKGEVTQVDLQEKISLIAGDVTCQFFFGSPASGKMYREVPLPIGMQKLFQDIMVELYSPMMAAFGPKFIRMNILPRHRKLTSNMKELKKIVSDMITENQKSGGTKNNLLGTLVEGRGNVSRLSDDEIVGEFIGIFAAGTDSISIFVSSAIYFLWKHPEVYYRVKQEVDEIFSDLTKIDAEAVNRMEYMNAFTKEVLRMGGPVGNIFTRVATKDDDLAGIKIKRGTLLNVYFPVFFTSERYFSDPFKFVPERWLAETPYPNDQWKNEAYAYTPFSAGARNCIGQHLAMIEGKIIIGLFMKTFNFSFDNDYKFVLVQKLSFQPKDPLLVTMNPLC